MLLMFNLKILKVSGVLLQEKLLVLNILELSKFQKLKLMVKTLKKFFYKNFHLLKKNLKVYYTGFLLKRQLIVKLDYMITYLKLIIQMNQKIIFKDLILIVLLYILMPKCTNYSLNLNVKININLKDQDISVQIMIQLQKNQFGIELLLYKKEKK